MLSFVLQKMFFLEQLPKSVFSQHDAVKCIRLIYQGQQNPTGWAYFLQQRYITGCRTKELYSSSLLCDFIKIQLSFVRHTRLSLGSRADRWVVFRATCNRRKSWVGFRGYPRKVDVNRVLTTFFTVLVGATPFSLAAGFADQTQVMITNSDQSVLVGYGKVENGKMTLELSGAAPGTKVDFVFATPQNEIIPLSGTVQNDGTIQVDTGGREIALSTWLESKNVVLSQTLANKPQPTNDDNKLERVPEAEAPLVTPSTPDIGGESGVESALPQPAPPPKQSHTQPKADGGAHPATSPDAALPPKGTDVPPAPGAPSPDSAAGAEPTLNSGNAADGSAEDSAGQSASPQNASPDAANPENPDVNPNVNPGNGTDGSTDSSTDGSVNGGTDGGANPGASPTEPDGSAQPAPQDGAQPEGATSGSDPGGDSSSNSSSNSGENVGETPPATPAPATPAEPDNGADNSGAADDPGGTAAGSADPGAEPSPGPSTEPEASPADPSSPPSGPDTPDNGSDSGASPADNGAAGDAGLAEPAAPEATAPEPTPEPAAPTATDDSGSSGASEGTSSATGEADGSQTGDGAANADSGATGDEPPAPAGP